jgi:hypothetical protein
LLGEIERITVSAREGTQRAEYGLNHNNKIFPLVCQLPRFMARLVVETWRSILRPGNRYTTKYATGRLVLGRAACWISFLFSMVAEVGVERLSVLRASQVADSTLPSMPTLPQIRWRIARYCPTGPL